MLGDYHRKAISVSDETARINAQFSTTAHSKFVPIYVPVQTRLTTDETEGVLFGVLSLHFGEFQVLLLTTPRRVLT